LKTGVGAEAAQFIGGEQLSLTIIIVLTSYLS
jgi:hypothetical protein